MVSQRVKDIALVIHSARERWLFPDRWVSVASGPLRHTLWVSFPWGMLKSILLADSFTDICRLDIQSRSRHILQCTRRSLNAAPYQQINRNGRRAHHRTNRAFLEWCHLCVKWFHRETDWQEHCCSHLGNLQPRCGFINIPLYISLTWILSLLLGEPEHAAWMPFQAMEWESYSDTVYRASVSRTPWYVISYSVLNRYRS